MGTADLLPRWGLMWLLSVAVFALLKWLTWWNRSAGRAAAWRHVCYLFAWPGLDADSFLYGDASSRSAPSAKEWLLAVAKTLFGVVLLWVIWPTLANHAALMRGWIGMIGVALVLHFGLFHLLSCLWRRIGVPARPLMDRPLCASGVSEFWARRWNTAFRDVAHAFLFRPLAKRVGASGALLVGFLVSGLIHELVISVPAGGGYGGPTLYFLIQAGGIGLERALLHRTANGARGVAGWLFTVAVVAGPAFVLFHPPFVRTIVVPFLDVITGVPCVSCCRP